MGRTIRMHTPLRTRSAWRIFVEYAFRVGSPSTRPQTLFFTSVYLALPDDNADFARFGVKSLVSLVIADDTRPTA